MPVPILLLGAASATVGSLLAANKENGPPMTLTEKVERALKTIRTMESGGNYTAKNAHSSASGAYQFLDTTWARFGGYARACEAPPEVQDQKARGNVAKILRDHHDDVQWVPAVWYAGPAGAMKIDWSTVVAPEAGNKSTIRQYVDKWMAVYNKLGKPGGA